MKQVLFLSLVLLMNGTSYAAIKGQVNRNDLSQDTLLIELTGKDYTTLSEVALYTEIIASYRSQDELALNTMVPVFIKRFPKSVFADNALYLSARLSLEKKKYIDSVRMIQKLLTNYPHSKKVVSAKFLKALAYKDLHLSNESKRTLREVIKMYPGSPESLRAKSELKLMMTK